MIISTLPDRQPCYGKRQAYLYRSWIRENSALIEFLRIQLPEVVKFSCRSPKATGKLISTGRVRLLPNVFSQQELRSPIVRSFVLPSFAASFSHRSCWNLSALRSRLHQQSVNHSHSRR